MSDRDRVLNLLRGHIAHRISFTFPGTTGVTVTVNSSTFQRVASAIENGRVHLNIANPSEQSVGAAYNRWDNVLTVGSTVGRRHEGYIIHESVHTSFDLVLSRNAVPLPDNEAAAYIATWLYWRMMGYQRQDNPRRPHTNELHNLARRIADLILRTGEIDQTMLNRFRRVIETHPISLATSADCYHGDG
jgi:hypothetical protein